MATRKEPTNSTPAGDLLNIGPKSAGLLKEIGIVTRADLERIGPALAYRILKHRFPGVTLNMLYGLHCALTGERWDRLDPATKAWLREEADAVEIELGKG